MLIGDHIECGKHNGRFDVKDGSCQQSPVYVPIKTFAVKEEGGKLYFKVPSEAEWPASLVRVLC